jgi:hypothetical protein
VRLSQRPTVVGADDSSSEPGRQLARVSTSTDGRTSEAGIAPKTLTPPSELLTAGADQGPTVARATGPWGRTSHRPGSNRTATATAGASGAKSSASEQ